MVVVPAESPVITPVLPAVATLVLLLLHVPPLVRSDKVIVAVGQTTDGPVIVPADGVVLTVTTTVAAAAPQLLLTV